MTGYDLINESARIIALLESPEGADADELDPVLSSWLDATDDKLGAYYAVCQRLDSEDALQKAVADKVASRRKYLAGQRDRVRTMAAALLESREALGEEPKVKRPDFTAWLQASEAVEVVDERALPPDLVKTTISADKAAIKIALKSGREVPGCSLVTSRSVRFK